MPFSFITGGASSGKSRYALELFSTRDDVSFIATAVRTDAEMARRIEDHRRQRPASWETIEEALDLVSAVKRMKETNRGLIIDCLTIWISNLIYMGKFDHETIMGKAEHLAALLKNLDKTALVVSNELGMGIIPASAESRAYRKLAGEVNQVFARSSSEAFLIVSGIAVKIT